MIFYLSNPYGTIPGEDWREYRFFLLAKALAEDGHEVVWFTSTFSHHFKMQRATSSKCLEISPNLKIHLVKSPPYKNNFSLRRWIRDLSYGVNLIKILKYEYKKPDLFINGDSPLTFYFPSYQYCRRYKIPYIIDQMDLWPELIIESIPKSLRLFAKISFIFHFRFRNIVFKNASGIISLAKRYLEIPIKYSSNKNLIANAVIYNGIDVLEFRSQSFYNKFPFEEYLPDKALDEVWCVFAGTLGPSYDIKTMISAFDYLSNEKRIKLIIAGDGSERRFVEDYIKNSSNLNVIYLGKLNKLHLAKLYSLCDIGLNAYGPFSNVEMPDKFYDYTAAGLAIINSLKGEVNEIIRFNKLGYSYTASDVNSLLSVLKIYLDNTNALLANKANSYNIASAFDQKVQLTAFKSFINQIIKNAH